MRTKKITMFCLFALLLLFASAVYGAGQGRVSYDLGVFALNEEHFIAAEQYFKEALQKEPENSYYLHYLGKTYLKMKRPADAVGPLETAEKLNPDISGLRYDLAIAYYEAGRYVRAEELFAELVARNPDSVLARYYLGMTYFRQDRYGLALPSLLRSGEENRSVRDNSYYFAGISHYKIGQPGDALEKLEYVETRAVSEKLRDSARRWQEVIRAQRAGSTRYSLYLKLGLEYDDNVRLDPVNEDLFADEGDFLATAYFSGKYRLVNTLKRKLGIGYSHYMTRYRDLSEFDLSAGVVSLFYQERLSSELYVTVQYNPSHYWLDNDHYLFRNRLGTRLLYRLDDKKGLQFSYGFTDNDYLSARGRSGQDHDFKLDFFSMLFDKKGGITVGIGYGHRSSVHPDYEHDLVSGRIEFSYKLPLELKFVVRGAWDRKDYDNVDSMHGRQRRDDRYSGGLELSRPLFYEWLQLQAEYRYTRNESNIDYYSYRKNVTGIFLVSRF